MRFFSDQRYHVARGALVSFIVGLVAAVWIWHEKTWVGVLGIAVISALFGAAGTGAGQDLNSRLRKSDNKDSPSQQ